MPRTKSQSAFYHLNVNHSVRDAVQVVWTMRRDFVDRQPWTFQLQVNRNQNDPDDWTDVGTTVTNGSYAVDVALPRLFGERLRNAYRVLLTTPVATYTSEIAPTMGNLSKRQWLQARAFVRRAVLQPTQLADYHGYLLKRKTHGTVCSDCVDPYTGKIVNSDCDTCKGTGKVTGYWKAAEHIMIDKGVDAHRTMRDGKQVRGHVDDLAMPARFLGFPQMARDDVWVERDSDRRFYVDSVKSEEEMDSVPLVVQVGLRLAELTDVIYTIDIETGS